MEISGSVELDASLVKYIREHSLDKVEKLRLTEDVLFDGKVKEDFSASIQKEKAADSSILLLLSVSYDKEWTAKQKIKKNPGGFKQVLPPLPEGARLYLEDRLLIRVVIHTSTNSGQVARRELGELTIKFKHILKATEHAGNSYVTKLTPMVNESDINNYVIVGAVSNVKFRSGKGPERVVGIRKRSDERRSEKNIEQLISKLIFQDEKNWSQSTRNNRTEIKDIYLNSWRTPKGKVPIQFFFTDRNAFNTPSCPGFFENALTIAADRLGSSVSDFVALATLALKDSTGQPDQLEARVQSMEILGTALAAVVTCSPYTADVARIPMVNAWNRSTETKIVGVEQFARSSDINSGDCEDGSVTMLGLLIRLTVANWISPPSPSVVLASKLINRYVLFGNLSSVTSPDVASAQKSSVKDKVIAIDSRHYLNLPFTGHSFVFCLPEKYFQNCRTKGEVVSDADYWPVLIQEPTGPARVLPLPTPAYRGASLLANQSSPTDEVQEGLISILHENVATLKFGKKRRAALKSAFAGFTPVMKDEEVTDVEFTKYPLANVSAFYRFIMHAYRVDTKKKCVVPYITGSWGDNRIVGVNYRLLATGHRDFRLYNTPRATKEERHVVEETRLNCLYPSMFPHKTAAAGTKVVESGGDTMDYGIGVARFLRSGYMEPQKIKMIKLLLDELVKKKELSGYEIVKDNFGEFKASSGSWDEEIDDAFQVTRLNLYPAISV